jgi:hypothetical protein
MQINPSLAFKNNKNNTPSSSISSSVSTSSPGLPSTALISALASLGRLKLVLLLLLDAVLADLADEARPALLSDVLREDGPDVSAPVGDNDLGEDDKYSIGECTCPPRSSDGISVIRSVRSHIMNN